MEKINEELLVSTLEVKATASLKKKVEEELEVADPTPEKAKAIFYEDKNNKECS